MKNVGELSNEALLAGVQAAIGQERRWVARVVAYLAEIERRRLLLEAACLAGIVARRFAPQSRGVSTTFA